MVVEGEGHTYHASLLSVIMVDVLKERVALSSSRQRETNHSESHHMLPLGS